MNAAKSSETLRGSLARVLPGDALSFDEGVRLAYSTDNSRLRHLPDCVAWPASEDEVAAIVKVANETRAPVHVRGRGTATTGSSLAEGGGMVVSTERMDKIVDIDSASRTATVQPGVVNGDLAKALLERGLLWPPDPSSAPYCSVGGNIATAAAGPRGVRYGGVRENVLAVRAVCGDGRVVRSGARVHKSSVGYDLARLLVGSEGTLAIVTEATLRLVPVPGAAEFTVAAFACADDALGAVARLMESSANPAQVEFVDEGCLELVGEDAGSLPNGAKALLLLSAEGLDKRAATREMQAITEAISGPPLLASVDVSGKDSLWSVRKVLSQRLRDVASNKVNEDLTVPVDRLAELVALAKGLCSEAGIRNLNFGHAGLGNLHVNLLFDDASDMDRAHGIVAKLMEWVVKAGGSISGEHGIGITKRGFLPLQVDANSQELMSRIKEAFDPNRIFHPGATQAAQGEASRPKADLEGLDDHQ